MFRQFTAKAIQAAKPHVTNFVKNPSMQRKAAIGMAGVYGFTCAVDVDRLYKNPLSNIFTGSIGAILLSIGGEIVVEVVPLPLLPVVAPLLGVATLHKIYSDFSNKREHELEAQIAELNIKLQDMQNKEE